MYHYKTQHQIWLLIKKINTIGFSITVLLLIAFFSMFGTIIEQEKTSAFYKMKYPDESLLNWTIIEQLGLNHIYTHYIFLILLGIFLLSIISCSLSTQIPSLKNARRWKFRTSCNTKQSFVLSKPVNRTYSYPKYIYELNEESYNVFHKGLCLYAHKGIWGRIGPVFVHLSIILLMIGCLISATTNFCAQEMITKGEISHIQNIVHSGPFNKLPTNIILEITNFTIIYYPDNSIKQFKSTVRLLDNNYQEQITREILVNKPLKFQGMTVYQTDWEVQGIRLQLNEREILQIPLKPIFQDKTVSWFCTVKYHKNDGIILLLSNLHDIVKCYTNNGDFISDIPAKQNVSVQDLPIKIIDIISSTGLEVKKDTGIPIIFFSFLILMISSSVSYISYSQIWIIQNRYKTQIFGYTSRAQLTFEEDIYTIYTRLNTNT